jgi:hypothetical protein
MADLLLVTTVLAMPVSLFIIVVRASSIAARMGLTPQPQS